MILGVDRPISGLPPRTPNPWDLGPGFTGDIRVWDHTTRKEFPLRVTIP